MEIPSLCLTGRYCSALAGPALLISLVAVVLMLFPGSTAAIAPFDDSIVAIAKAPNASFTFDELIQSIHESGLPPGFVAPAYYGDPNLFLQKENREATALTTFWFSLPQQQRLALLQEIIYQEPASLIPILMELTWYGIGLENDEFVADRLRAAVSEVIDRNLPITIALHEHIANFALHASVRNKANAALQGLYYRRNTVGR